MDTGWGWGWRMNIKGLGVGGALWPDISCGNDPYPSVEMDPTSIPLSNKKRKLPPNKLSLSWVQRGGEDL